MTDYIELASADDSIRVRVKSPTFDWIISKSLKVIQRAVVKSNQPSQGGSGTPTIGLFDNLKVADSFTLASGILDNLLDADGVTVSTKETKRNNIRQLMRNGQTFKLKWDDDDGTSQSFDVNINGNAKFTHTGGHTSRILVTLPLIAGTNWGSG